MYINMGQHMRRKHQSGFSLLEVLVTILILAIGLLGLAGLIASSMRNNHGAFYRTQAVWLAYDISDRMRANRQLALSGSYNFNNLASGTVPTAGTSIASIDLAQWSAAAATLPSGRVSAAVDGGTRRVIITVQWNDTRATNAPDAAAQTEAASRQFSMQTQL